MKLCSRQENSYHGKHRYVSEDPVSLRTRHTSRTYRSEQTTRPDSTQLNSTQLNRDVALSLSGAFVWLVAVVVGRDACLAKSYVWVFVVFFVYIREYAPPPKTRLSSHISSSPKELQLNPTNYHTVADCCVRSLP